MIEAVHAFALAGNPVSCEPYGHGHINGTYLVITDQSQKYILQRVNHNIFRDVPALMRNIALVTQHLAQADPTPRHVLELVHTTDGQPFHLDGDGAYWRVYTFIADSLCLQQAESSADFYQSAVAFGRFQNLLADFPAETLSETIPRFHDTPHRFVQLRQAIDADTAGRVQSAQPEIDFYLAREAESAYMTDMLSRGELPLRVTHNDTKLNNVMLDAKMRTALCVIDLDTVMPGLAGNDFGDSIRFGASTAAEDEMDLDKVQLSLPLYRAYTEGFLSECGSRLTASEIQTLPWGAKLMTLECGTRFLADFLNGDVYYHTSRERHNLDRARTQIKLVAEMERHWQEMHAIIADVQKGAMPT